MQEVQPPLSLTPPSTTVNKDDSSFKGLIGIDTIAGLKISSNKHSLYLKMLSMFHDSYGNFMNEFLTKQQSSPPDVAIRAVHSLKGAAATIGATLLKKAAEKLETVCEEYSVGEEGTEALKQLEAELTPVITGLGNYLDDTTG